MSRRWRLLAAGAALSLAVFALRAAAVERKPAEGDWPQWRGPARDAVSTETGLLREWSEGGPELAWKATGLGRGYSSVVISEGKIFTLGDRGGDEFVIALDRADGHELWATRIGGAWSDGGPRCTPTVDGDRLYALTPHGDLACLDTASGEVKWQKNFGQDFGGRMMSGWGFCESPLIDGNKLICTPGGEQAGIAALNKQNGRTIWTSVIPPIGDGGGDGAGYSSVVVSEGAGVRQYVQLMGRGLVSVAANDGRFLWGYNRIANGTANIPTPIVRDNHVFTSTGYGTGAALLKLKRQGRGVAYDEVYFLPSNTLQNHHGGMVLLGDYLYGGHGHNSGFPICVEFATGEVVWDGGRGPGEGSAAVVCADGNLYFHYQNGTVALIEATPEDYRERGSFEVPNDGSPCWAHPVVAGGKLYLREQDELLCYDVTP